MKNTIKFANWVSKWSSWNQIFTISLATLVFVVIVVFLMSLKRRKFFSFSKTVGLLTNKSTKDEKILPSQHHNWHFQDLFTKPTYCNVCESVMVSGVCCTYCNLYADEKCLKKADKLFKCKQVCETIFSVNREEEKSTDVSKAYKRKWLHHWIKGNLHLDSVCHICNENDCGNAPNLNDYKCVWCWRNAHEKCLNSVSTPSLVDECNYGLFRRILLKPNLIVQTTRTSNLSLRDVKLDENLVTKYESDPNEWTPLFVFANRKSGSNDADQIIYGMTRILNPLQVIEMNKINPMIVLNWIAEYSHLVKFKILVCGGDGSVGWILDCLSTIKFKKYEPAVGILPLGTGNDLSRALKWGEGYVGDVDIEDLLGEIDHAIYTTIDRWQIRIKKFDLKRNLSTSSHDTINQNEDEISQTIKLKYMNNYISVGCDALVTLNFHRQRNNLFFANRILNKLIYFKYGTIDTFLKECRHLTENVQLELDGKLIELPHLESIVVLNIPYWGGGVVPWSLGQSENRTDIPKQSINDGLLEVFGIYSSFHIAQLQVGLAEPFRIGQAKRVRIKLFKRFPVQIDGEPWEQSPATIEITHLDQKTMLEKVSISQN